MKYTLLALLLVSCSKSPKEDRYLSVTNRTVPWPASQVYSNWFPSHTNSEPEMEIIQNGSMWHPIETPNMEIQFGYFNGTSDSTEVIEYFTNVEYLQFGNSFVVSMPPDQFHQMATNFPTLVKTNNFSFVK